jgi:predicted Rossmann-fold nucleotide-binding protein
MTLAPVADVIAPSVLKGYDLSDFLYPIGSTKPERESRSWAKESGQRAGALRAMAILGGAEHVGSTLAIKPVEDYRAAIYVSADDKKPVQKEFRSDARKLTAAVQPYPKIETLSDVQQKMFAPHDGIVLSFDNPNDPSDYAARFITYGYVFFSAMVAQQTRDKYILGKMVAVLDSTRQKDDDKIINRLAAMTYDLHRLGAIPQDPTTLWKTFGNVVELAQSTNDAKKEMFRYPAFSYADGPMVMEEKGKPSIKDYHAAILLTASLKSSAVLEPTQQMTEALCAANIGVVSGAGLNNGGMGVVTHTVQDLANRGKDVHHTGITTPHIRDFEASGNIEKMVSHYVLTKNIYGRMDGLSRADTGLVLPGGAGTLQEMFADLLLMQLAKDAKGQHSDSHRNNQIIVMNTPIIDGGSRRGFYDGVLQQMPERILTDYPVHVANNVNQAMGLIGTHRDAMRAAGRTTSFNLNGL